jgi:hypothetical protein
MNKIRKLLRVKGPIWCDWIWFYCRRSDSSTCFGGIRPSSGATRITPAACILCSLLESGGVSSGGVRRVDAEQATSGLLTPPLSSKLLRIPYAAGVILVTPDDVRIRPKHVEISQFLRVAYDGSCSLNVSVRMAWISNDTIDTVLRHRDVGRAKDLSAPPVVPLKTLLLPVVQNFV